MNAVADALKGRTRSKRSVVPTSRRGAIKAVIDRVSDVAIGMATEMSFDSVVNTITFWDEDRLDDASQAFVKSELRHIKKVIRGTANKDDDIKWKLIENTHPDDSLQDEGRRYANALALRLLNGTLASRLQEFVIKNPETGALLTGVLHDIFDNIDVDTSDLDPEASSPIRTSSERLRDSRLNASDKVNKLGLDPLMPEREAITTDEAYLLAHLQGSERSAETFIIYFGGPELSVQGYRSWLEQNGFR